MLGATARRTCLAAALSLVASSSGAASAASGWRVERAVPDWVVDVPAAHLVPAANDATPDVAYLLVDIQERVAADSVERYFHYARRVVSTPGIERTSELSFEFDPSFETLAIHSITVRRAEQPIDALRPDDLKLVQRETELDRRIYDGSLAVLAFLHDVRVGDVVEYAFSVRGANPVLGGRFLSSVELAYGVPVAAIRHRLLWPSERPLEIRNHATTLTARVTEQGTVREYLWSLDAIPEVESEDQLPDWYELYPWVQVSEFRSWADVAAWALPLYADAGELPAELEQSLADWRDKLASPDERLLAAVRLVQDEIRYLGMEIGPHSLEPHRPATVYARRFGDCKDKSLLLVAMLRRLGIEAEPALVSTDFGQALASLAPSPYAFDHAIVRARIGAHDYWFDATQSLERGELARRLPPPFHRALIVAPDSNDLVDIPLAAPAEPDLAVSETLVIESYRKPARLGVVSTYRGSRADELRQQLASTPLKELEKTSLNFYANDDPLIELAAPLSVSDDEARNEIVLRESYLIPKVGSIFDRDFRASTISDELERPAVKLRKLPLAIEHPISVTHDIRIEAPDLHDFETESQTVASDALEFRYASSFRDGALCLSYALRSKADHVTAARVPHHLRAVDTIEEYLSLSIERPDGASTGGSGPTLRLNALRLLAVAGAGALLGLVLLPAWRRRRERMAHAQHARRAPGDVADAPSSSSG